MRIDDHLTAWVVVSDWQVGVNSEVPQQLHHLRHVGWVDAVLRLSMQRSPLSSGSDSRQPVRGI